MLPEGGRLHDNATSGATGRNLPEKALQFRAQFCNERYVAKRVFGLFGKVERCRQRASHNLHDTILSILCSDGGLVKLPESDCPEPEYFLSNSDGMPTRAGLWRQGGRRPSTRRADATVPEAIRT